VFRPRSAESEPRPGNDAGEASGLRTKPKRTTRSPLWDIVETLVLAVVIFVGVRNVVLNFRVDGRSMEPNLHNGEMLIVNRQVYFHIDVNDLLDWLPGSQDSGTDEWYPFHPPQRGDIVVFQPPTMHSEPYIKRIIGLPGERVSIHDGAVHIDGKRLDEPYLNAPTNGQGVMTDGSHVVEPDHVFVLGDNRGNSSDSRMFGSIPISSIIGKASVSYWPPDEIEVMPQPAYALN
jgi:signal peptidase I